MTVLNYRGNPVTEQDLGLWQGDIVTLLPDCKEPKIRWTGAPIPSKFFGQMLGFFRHAHATWQSEAMVRLAYNKAKAEWGILCYPQTIRQGMEVKEIKDLSEEQKAIRDAALASLGDGFQENGSCHSHCDASAFQSGTDLTNELKNTGVHITLGKINTDRPHVHGRVSFRGIMYPINWAEWFEGWPVDMDGRVDTFDLIPGNDTSFPETWLKSCFEPPPVKSFFPAYTPGRFASKATSYTRNSSYGFGSSYWDDDFDYAEDKRVLSVEDIPERDIPDELVGVITTVNGADDIQKVVDLLWTHYFDGVVLSTEEYIARMVMFDLMKDDMRLAQEALESFYDLMTNGYQYGTTLDYLDNQIDQVVSGIENLRKSDLDDTALREILEEEIFALPVDTEEAKVS